MRRLLPLLLLLAVSKPAVATDDAVQIENTCAVQAGCSAVDIPDPSMRPPELYVLTEDSAWLEGCIVGPCLCPVVILDELTGFFTLAELPTSGPGPWRLFEVLDVEWTLGRGEARSEIRGRGLYRTAAPVLDEHSLLLDLELDGDPIETLDSGVVSGALPFPEIDILALTSGECFQEGVQLAAVPVPEPSRGMQQLAGLLALYLLSLRKKGAGRRHPRAWRTPGLAGVARRPQHLADLV